MSKYPKILNRDAIKCRVMRDRKWVEVCFTDLTPEEQERVVEHNDAAFICKHLTEIIRNSSEIK